MTYVKTLGLRATSSAALVAVVCAVTMASPQAQDGQPQKLPLVPLQAGMHVIQAGLAQTPLERQIGLMFRRDMPPNEGMLFVFERPERQCFWMRNTPLPLTIAFLADDGRIVNLSDMKPFSDDSHCSTEPVRLVLEMHQGWFAKRGLKAGVRLKGEPFRR